MGLKNVVFNFSYLLKWLNNDNKQVLGNLSEKVGNLKMLNTNTIPEKT